ncbi:MAG: hypothetical protein HY906_25845, partial [Deltaproteobacteria bacterium]|nr:hypothetical protein [Deltaproteobacteria bacterium]
MRSRICPSLAILAAVLCGTPAFGQGEAAPSRAELDRARKAYTEGAAAYQLGKFDEAAKRFEQSYRIMKFPTMLFDIAQCYRRLYETTKTLDHLKKAVDLYQAFLREAPPNAGKRPAAQQLVIQLQKTLAAEAQRRREQLISKAVGREGLLLAEQLLFDGSAKEAGLVIDRVLASRQNPRDVLIAALEKRALISGRLGQAEAATDAFRRVLALDPGFLLPEGTDKVTAAAFAGARRFWQGKRPLTIAHVPPGDVQKDQPARIAITIESDPLEMIAQFALSYRLAGQGAYSMTRAPARAGALEVPATFLKGVRGGTRIEYYVTALDQLESELAALGSPQEPFVFMVAPPHVDGGGGVRDTGGPAASRWYRKWWVWTIVGAVAAGGAGAG